METMNKEETTAAARRYHPRRICAVCGTEYQPKNIRRTYCSSLCRWRAFSMKKTGESPDMLGEGGIYSVGANEMPAQTNGAQTQIQPKTSANPTENSRKEFSLTENQRKTNGNPTENSGEEFSLTENQRKTNANPTENDFVKAIADIVNERGLDEKFISPFEHWQHEQAEAIRKVNRYLRCLLKSTLNLSRQRKIPAAALRDLANGYAYVLSSETFAGSGHPYGEFISGLHRKLSSYYKQFRNNSKLRLVLKREDKIEIISMLHEIGNSVQLSKFSELFSLPHT